MIEKVAALIFEVYRNKGKILICGNGGLAAESEHFAAELVGKFAQDVFIPCFALTTNSSLVTAIGNDLGFEQVFAHQVRVLGQKQDMLIAMTTSNSMNVVKALEAAYLKEMKTVAICSERSLLCADVLVQLPGDDVAEVQNEVLKFLHQVAIAAKKEIYDQPRAGKPQ